MRIRSTLLAALLLAVSSTVIGAPAAQPLEPFEAQYAWIWHGMTVASTTLRLERSGEEWVYRSKSEPRGIGRMFAERPTQESRIRLTNEGAEPLSYTADDGTPSTKRDAHVTFDWSRGRVTGVYEDTPVDMPTEPGLQDDLSVQIDLMVALLRGRTPTKLALLDKNTVREYLYTRDGEETLKTPLGTLATVVFRSQKQGSPRVTRFWCAPTQGFIPLRVEQKRLDEIEWTMQIESLRRGTGN